MEPTYPILALIDTETTGLSEKAQVTEVAVRAYHRKPDSRLGSRSGYEDYTRVYKVKPLRDDWQDSEEWQSAAQIQKKTTEEVEAHTWRLPDVVADLAQLFEGHSVYWIAHNAEFDRRLLTQSLGVTGQQWWSSPWFCTLRLQYGSASHRLSAIARHYNIGSDAAHSALGDVMMLDEILQKYSDAIHRDMVIRAPVYSKLTALLPLLRLVPLYP